MRNGGTKEDERRRGIVVVIVCQLNSPQLRGEVIARIVVIPTLLPQVLRRAVAGGRLGLLLGPVCFNGGVSKVCSIELSFSCRPAGEAQRKKGEKGRIKAQTTHLRRGNPRTRRPPLENPRNSAAVAGPVVALG